MGKADTKDPQKFSNALALSPSLIDYDYLYRKACTEKPVKKTSCELVCNSINTVEFRYKDILRHPLNYPYIKTIISIKKDPKMTTICTAFIMKHSF